MPTGPYSDGEMESLRELARDHPMLFTFTQHAYNHFNLDASGHVALQIAAYKMHKRRNAARRLEETYARAATPKDF